MNRGPLRRTAHQIRETIVRGGLGYNGAEKAWPVQICRGGVVRVRACVYMCWLVQTQQALPSHPRAGFWSRHKRPYPTGGGCSVERQHGRRQGSQHVRARARALRVELEQPRTWSKFKSGKWETFR